MTRRARRLRILLVAACALATLACLYLSWIRPWQLRWGATDQELARTMPGDELIAEPTFDATRAVTVEASPEHIWPWIVQIGYGRAGWYSYDWIDNLGRPSAERIIPELQAVALGDLVPMGPGGFGLNVKAFEPNKTMLWSGSTTTWAWGLYPEPGGGTRLVTRVRIQYTWTRPVIIPLLALDVGDIVMMRKCLLGIKDRAEHLARQTAPPRL